MPISINQNELKIRDENGNYQDIDVFSAGGSAAEMIAEIEQTGSETMTAMEQKATQTIASIPSDYTELSNNVDNIIESRGLIDCFLYIYDNAYVNKDGNITSLATYYCGFASVKQGEEFVISGSGWNNIYYLYYFLDESMNIISHAPNTIAGYVKCLHVVAPENARYIVINLSEGHTKSELRCMKRLGKEDLLLLTKPMIDFGRIRHRYYYKTSVGWSENGSMKAIECPCEAGDRFVISGTSYGTVYSSYTFFDASDNVIEQGGIPYRSISVQYKDHFITAPSGAAKLVVNNSEEANPSGPVCKKILTTNTEKEKYLFNHDQLLLGAIIYKDKYFHSSGSYTALEGYKCLAYKCLPGDRFVITARGHSTIYYAWNFLNANGEIIAHSEGIYPVTMDYRNYDVTAPANAAKLVINAGDLDLSVVKCASADYELNVSANSDNWLKGKKIVWFGTSIPAGSVNGKSYPDLVGEALGATVYNESVGSSAMGTYNISLPCLIRSLSLTYAEKQASSWWSSLSDSEKTLARDTSFDYKFTKYLTGGSVGQVDLYVFDHCYNDYYYPDPDDYMTEPVNPNDKSYPLGAANFLINAILSDNPRAKIVWIGHYENALLDPTDHQSWGKPTCELQEYISEKYGIPLCKTWEKTGWSNPVKITTTGYWSGTTWVPNGGTSRQDYVKNCAFSDGIHPNTDGSGESTRLIADIITKFLENIR